MSQLWLCVCIAALVAVILVLGLALSDCYNDGFNTKLNEAEHEWGPLNEMESFRGGRGGGGRGLGGRAFGGRGRGPFQGRFAAGMRPGGIRSGAVRRGVGIPTTPLRRAGPGPTPPLPGGGIVGGVGGLGAIGGGPIPLGPAVRGGRGGRGGGPPGRGGRGGGPPGRGGRGRGRGGYPWWPRFRRRGRYRHPWWYRYWPYYWGAAYYYDDIPVYLEPEINEGLCTVEPILSSGTLDLPSTQINKYLMPGDWTINSWISFNKEGLGTETKVFSKNGSPEMFYNPVVDTVTLRMNTQFGLSDKRGPQFERIVPLPAVNPRALNNYTWIKMRDRSMLFVNGVLTDDAPITGAPSIMAAGPMHLDTKGGNIQFRNFKICNRAWNEVTINNVVNTEVPLS